MRAAGTTAGTTGGVIVALLLLTCLALRAMPTESLPTASGLHVSCPRAATQ